MDRLGQVNESARHYLVGVGRAAYVFRYGAEPSVGELTDMLNTELGLMINELGLRSLGELLLRTHGDIDTTLAVWVAAAVRGEEQGEFDVVSLQPLPGQDGSSRNRNLRVRRPN